MAEADNFMKPSTLVPLATLFAALPAISAAQYSLEQLWTIPPDSRAYLTSTGSAQRGLAYNRNTGHLLLVNRATDFTIHVLNAADGEDLGLILDTSALVGGGNSSFLLNLVGVADDGSIYAANLSNSTTAPHVNIYRWESETAPQTLVFSGDPVPGNIQRWGDTLDVRGGGTITELLMGSRGNIAVIFNIDNGPTFVPRVITTETLPGSFGYGVSYGAGNTFWGTAGASTGGPLHLYDYNLVPARTVQSFPDPIVPGGLTVFDVDPTRHLLVGLVFGTPDRVDLYDVSSTASAPVLQDSEVFPSDNANGVFAGSVQISGDRLFVLNNNNGIVAYEIKTAPALAPEIIVEPVDQLLPTGSKATFSIAVKGATPLTYQWFKNNNPLAGQTSSTLTITSVGSADVGEYKVTVSNAVGSDTSAVANLNLTDPPPESPVIPLWNIAAGTRPYISNTGSSQRGMAYNHVTDHVLVPNRAGGLSIPILSGQTGEETGSTLATTGISGGSVSLTQMAVADDGVIYGCNLVTSSGLTSFRIYRWATEQAEPTVAFADLSAVSPQRWGDSFDVRGSGNSTQILLGAGVGNGAGDGTVVALLTTENGVDFSATQLTTDTPPLSFAHGVSFGQDNTFWATSQGGALYHMRFDLQAGTASTVHSYTAPVPLTLTALDVVPFVLGGDILIPDTFLVAGISVATPDQFLIFKVNTQEKTAAQIGEFAFPTDVANSTGTGAVEIGNNRLMAYDTNNGLMMFRYRDVFEPPASLSISRSGQQITISWAAPSTAQLQSTTELGSASNWQNVTTPPTQSGNTLSVQLEATGTTRFFRLVK